MNPRKPRLVLEPLQKRQMVPKMMVASTLMALPVLELEAHLERVLEENPLLEIREGTMCFGCGTEIPGYPDRCPRCGRYLGKTKRSRWRTLHLWVGNGDGRNSSLTRS